MKNMKVSQKLMISFTIVIILAIITGIVGIVGTGQMYNADKALYNANYLPTANAGDIAETFIHQRVFLRNFIIFDKVNNSEDFKKAEEDLAASKVQIEKLLKTYAESIDSEEDQDTFDEFKKIYINDWLPILDDIHSLGAADKTEEAKEALRAGAPASSRLEELAKRLQGINLADGQEKINANTRLFTNVMIAVVTAMLFAVAVSIFFAIYISGLISKPLIPLTAFMSKGSATGDLRLKPEDMEDIKNYSQRTDEIGQLIASAAAFVNRINEVSDELEVIAKGDLTSQIPLLSDKDTIGLSLLQMIPNLSKMFAEINSSTMQVSIASKQIAYGSQALAQGSTEQASAVEQLSCSIAEIAYKTKENARLAESAQKLGNIIKSNAEKGSEQMGNMVQAVKEIGESSRSIGKIIKLIDDIAFQTNILALNAAVEASRAGQHGKGFAIVAEEVRNLAAKSADAAKDTDSLITSSIKKTEFGVNIANETAQSLVEIVSGINENSNIVEKIAVSSEEQTVAIDQINKGIEQVAQVIAQNSGTAEESAAAGQEMSGQAAVLEDLVSQFKLK